MAVWSLPALAVTLAVTLTVTLTVTLAVTLTPSIHVHQHAATCMSSALSCCTGRTQVDGRTCAHRETFLAGREDVSHDGQFLAAVETPVKMRTKFIYRSCFGSWPFWLHIFFLSLSPYLSDEV